MRKMKRLINTAVRGLFICLFLLVLVQAGAYHYMKGRVELHPFSTDGCSLFPDNSFLSGTDLCGICFRHDQAYWRGGTSAERLAADRLMREEVISLTGRVWLGRAMYWGVRIGGSPYLMSGFRWGYGWTYGRGYRSLSTEEATLAGQFMAAYLAEHPDEHCP